MTTIGSDPDALDRLARELVSASAHLDGVTRRIDGALARAGWRGPDGDRFRRSWSAVHRRRLSTSAERCRALAKSVARHADEQRRASRSTGALNATTRLTPLRDATIHHGEISASLGPLVAGLSGTLTIEEVGDRRRITYADELQAGAGLSAGRAIDGHLGGIGAAGGASTGAAASIENTVRRTWVVDADEVSGLLVALALEQGITHVPGGLESRAASQGVRVLDWLGDAVGMELPSQLARLGDGLAVGSGAMPAPTRTEDLLGVGLDGTALAALGLGATVGSQRAAADLRGTVRAGTAVEGRHRSLVLEADGAAAGSIAARLGADERSRSTATHVRVEVPFSRTDRPMLLTVTSGGSERIVTRMAIDPRLGAEAVGAAREALSEVIHGDPGAGMVQLGRIGLPAEAVQIDQHVERRTTSDGALSVSTPVASLSFEGSSERSTIHP